MPALHANPEFIEYEGYRALGVTLFHYTNENKIMAAAAISQFLKPKSRGTLNSPAPLNNQGSRHP